MNSPSIAIVDTGVGNLFNLARALEEVGAAPVVSSVPRELQRADRIVIPGVGSFAPTMTAFESSGIATSLRDYSAAGRPILGICLGMQLLMTHGFENGHTSGLGLLSGEVIPLPGETTGGELLRVPHIGWSRVFPREGSTISTWTGNLDPSVDVYFAHSYNVRPVAADAVAGQFTYGGHVLTAVVRQRNLLGVQFHPERSGPTGLRMLRHFAFGDSLSHGAAL